MRYLFDCESDGLLPELTKIHSLVLKDVDSGRVFSFANDGTPEGHEQIAVGCGMLMEAEQIIGHNIINFDLRALKKIYPWFHVDRSKVYDTYVMSLLLWPNLGDRDAAAMAKGKLAFPPGSKLKGSHSLRGWGYRLGLLKLEYDGGWDAWSPEMQYYCEIDVEVTNRLYHQIEKRGYAPCAFELEHEVKFICTKQETTGWPFDVALAEDLTRTLLKKRTELETALQDTFPPRFVSKGVFVPKRPNKTLGYAGEYGPEYTVEVWSKTKECLVQKTKRDFTGYPAEKIELEIFNPGSRQQIESRLRQLHGWKPKVFTPSGQAQIDETTLGELPWPEAKQLTEFFLLNKRLGQVAEGDKAWLKCVQSDGRVHGSVITNGAVTGRATHHDPNLAQVPANGALYGETCRACFTASKGRKLVGIDVSGLELRMLGHYMSKFDRGAYARIVVEGDAHWANTQALGLVNPDEKRDEHNHPEHATFRNGTKTFIYAFLYGAGVLKLAQTVFEIAVKQIEKGQGDSILRGFFGGRRKISDDKLRRIGSRLRKDFLNRTPALKKLIKSVKDRANKRGYLIGLDGRKLHVRSAHAALNTLLQSAGAIVCKMWMVVLDHEIDKRGWRGKVAQLGWIHDELQFDCDPDIAEEFGQVAVACIATAGERLKVKVPLTGEYNIGDNWKETH